MRIGGRGEAQRGACAGSGEHRYEQVGENGEADAHPRNGVVPVRPLRIVGAHRAAGAHGLRRGLSRARGRGPVRPPHQRARARRERAAQPC